MERVFDMFCPSCGCYATHSLGYHSNDRRIKMEAQSTTAAYKAMSQDDRKALQELRSYAAEKVGSEITLKDIICAVEPDLETPERLKGI
jgi:hypothetical protein